MCVWTGQMDSSSCVCCYWLWPKFVGVWKTTLRPRLYLNRNISVWLTHSPPESMANSSATQNILKRFGKAERQEGKQSYLLSFIFKCLNCFDLCVLKRENKQKTDSQTDRELERLKHRERERDRWKTSGCGKVSGCLYTPILGESKLNTQTAFLTLNSKHSDIMNRSSIIDSLLFIKLIFL